jgi:hypothetical protein
MAALVLLSQGCALLQVRHPLPEHLLDQAQVENLPGVRAWADASSESLEQSAKESMKQEMAANHGKLEPEANFLALSGGGGDGAFGAGILCGWTEAGTRPRFKLVTGISTGALIAPFAFLGPEYDAKLKEVYTTISDKDIYTGYGLVKLVLSLGISEGVPVPSRWPSCWSGSSMRTCCGPSPRSTTRAGACWWGLPNWTPSAW